MTDTTESDPKPILPFLAPFYRMVVPLAWPLVRIAIGWDLIVHGWGKVLRGPVQQAALLSRDGTDYGVAFAVFLTIIELGGGICIALGLFTRFFAAAIAIEMAFAFAFVHGPKGFPAGKGGFEYVLLIGIVMFVIAIRGGGPYSIDAKLGKEL